ncbi:hypothetical protein L0F81_22290 [Streptomyces tricolor]|uniref:Uncharacterized protein n=1 Tax=Streptomyces tricolor TaxID=68277 RepID=A0ABS9JKA1_9ACTN|nr:hypothetical protein [Streptomyces tricolor]MCG0065992.1 hypothetical protein [Streptomyces tricolor]
MTDTAPTTGLRRLSPRDESRVRLARHLWMLANDAFGLLPVDPDTPPGDLLRAALALQRDTEALVTDAVIAERERGTTWEQLAQAAEVTRQAAHERWATRVSIWSEQGRVCSSKESALDIAAFLDEQYSRYAVEEAPAAVSGGLDAVRFPDAPDERQRDRTQTLHERRADLARALQHWQETYTTPDESTGREDWLVLAANRSAAARTYDDLARVHDELVTAEPALADEHRTEAETYRARAADARSYADLALKGAQKAESTQ